MQIEVLVKWSTEVGDRSCVPTSKINAPLDRDTFAIKKTGARCNFQSQAITSSRRSEAIRRRWDARLGGMDVM